LLEFPLYYIDLSTVRFDEFEKSVASVSLQALSVLVKNKLNLDNYLQYIDIISDNSELLSPYIDDYTHLTYSACQKEWRKKIMDEFVLATHMDYAQLKEKIVTHGPAGQYFEDRGIAKAKAEYDKETKASVERMLRIKKHQYSTDEIAAIFGLAVEEVRELEAKVAGESAEA
jgi:hypothetical protein